MNLQPSQITIVGLAAMFLAWLLSLLIEKGIPWLLKVAKITTVTVDLGRWVKTLLVGASAFGLAWWWYPAALPALPAFTGSAWNQISQFFSYLPLFLASLSPYVGAAMSIYNLLLGYILDPEKRKQFVGWLAAQFLPTPPAVPPQQ